MSDTYLSFHEYEMQLAKLKDCPDCGGNCEAWMKYLRAIKAGD